MRSNSYFAALLLTAVLTGCSDDTPNDSQEAASTTSVPREIVWNEVPLGDHREVGFPAIMRLLRSMDYWHKGQVPVLAIEVAPDGFARDHLNNSVRMTATEWKTMLEGLRLNDEQPDQLFALSNDAWQRYDDDWGNVPQFLYEIQIESANRLVLTVLGPYERSR
jgi:hypothetical protein